MSTVVTSQPGQAGQRGQYMALTTAPPQVALPAGVPASLAYLAGLQEVRIHQNMELCKVLCGWEQNNSYAICNTQDLQFMEAKEDTSCFVRLCFGVARPFHMDVLDLQGNLLVRLYRPYRCQASPCWGCWLQEMEIQTPPGIVAGHVKQVWTCLRPKYKVYNNVGECVFTIVGECFCKYQFAECVDIAFRVYEGEGEAIQVAHIRKDAGGAKECCLQVSDFTLYLPGQLDIMKRALLFGATFLIDFNYFEKNA